MLGSNMTIPPGEVTIQPVELEITSDATLGYASYQNHVPPIRSIRVTNKAATAIERLDLTVLMDPPVAVPLTIRFDRVEVGETRRIDSVDLKCSNEHLSTRTESERGAYHVVARCGDLELARTSRDVEILANDQWAGLRGLPELLAAFSVPNDSVVDRYLGRAANLLRPRGASFNGYESDRDGVLLQAAAIYSVLAGEAISYSNPPASFLGMGQKIRLPERIADGRIATCLDTAMLFASCLEQAGIGPVVLLSETHAWIAFWLVKHTFSVPTIDDIQDVRKRVKAGEMIAFETTLITGSPPASFVVACDKGAQQLEGDGKTFVAIDVAAARAKRVRPLPSRNERTAPPVPDETAPFGELKLPDLPPAPPTEADIVVPEDTPQGRIRAWESKLLDLSMRNRLLNFKETKGTIPLLVADPGKLEDELFAGGEFRIEPNPRLMEGTDPRDAKVHRERTGLDAMKEMAREMFLRKRLLSNLTDGELENRLLDVFLAAKNSLEEGGANTLFIAFGFLLWDDDKAKKQHRAPLVLVPVSLKRQSVRSGYTLARHDDEALVNPTLLQMLALDNQLHVDGLSHLSRDDSGIDVRAAWQAFRKAVADVKGWEVREDIYLGNFSFTKYLMWKDLRSRLEDLKKNRVVAHLIDTPNQPYAGAAGMRTRHELDRDFEPHQLITPLICDSSQLQAIADADEGRDMVLDGPPGTGKSQTISNAIAHFLGQGKTVLFVSEKIAALNVVHDRLLKLGLGPFCLELHSAKAQKSEVVSELHNTLNLGQVNSAHEWESRATQLSARRQELNDFVRLLHQEHPNGLTIYQAAGTRILNSEWLPATFLWTDADTHDHVALDDLRELMNRICSLAEHFPNLQDQGLEGIGRTEWLPSWEDQLFAAIASLRHAIIRLEGECKAIEKACGYHLAGESSAGLSAFATLADELIRGAGMPAGLAAKPFDRENRPMIRELARRGMARNAAWSQMPGFNATVATLPATNLKASWAAAEATWWPKSALERRKVSGMLMTHRDDRDRPPRAAVPTILETLAVVNREDAAIERASTLARPLLGDRLQGLDTDWASLEPMVAWTERIEAACDKLAGAELEAIQRVRSLTTALLSQHQRLLAPSEMIAKRLLAFREAYVGFSERLRSVGDLSHQTQPIEGEPTDAGALSRALGTVDRWVNARQQVRSWCLWQSLRAQAVFKGTESIVQALETGVVSVARVKDFFEYSYQTWWLKRIIDREEVLRHFTGTDHERKIREFRRRDQEFQEISCQYIIAKAAARIPNANVPLVQESEVGNLRRQANRQRGHMPIRRLLSQMPTLLTRLKPCLLMSPLSVAQYLEASHQIFDIVIFDEASQIPVWDAVGAIARGRQLLVAGDPKQLPPTTFFQKTATDDVDGAAEGDGTNVVDLESMLDECLAAGLPRRRLTWHYRSRHESLITFSNHAYYGGDLITFPSPVTRDQAVSFIPVVGHYDRGASKTNRAEADAIVAEIQRHYLDETARKKSVGVVTFNQSQQQLIQRLLDERRRSSEALDRALAETSVEPLFIKNLENVQGDERDVILFSITYGPSAGGGVPMNFGPLNQEGGHRRLNVAITRAREGVKIFSTLHPEQMDMTRTRAAGVLDLKNYLEFAKKGPTAILERSTPTGREPDSPFEVAVIRALRERGWNVHPQVGCSNYRIDLAIVNPLAPGEYLLGVECDGRTYHSSATARDRDRLRQMVLEGLGWTLHRVWSTDWWHDAERETRRLHEVIQRRLELVQNPGTDGSPEVPQTDSSTAEPLRARGPQVDSATTASADALAKSGPAAVENPEFVREPAKGEPRTYEMVDLGTVREDFYEFGTDVRIRGHLLATINAEGPISEMVLFRRVARAWGIARIGNRISKRLEGLVPRECNRTHGGTTTFYWPAGIEPKAWRGLRVHDDHRQETCRHITEVCTEEIANLAAWLLAHNGQMDAQALARNVCMLVGMERVTDEALRHGRKGVDHLCESGRAILQAGKVVSSDV